MLGGCHIVVFAHSFGSGVYFEEKTWDGAIKKLRSLFNPNMLLKDEAFKFAILDIFPRSAEKLNSNDEVNDDR